MIALFYGRKPKLQILPAFNSERIPSFRFNNVELWILKKERLSFLLKLIFPCK